MRIGAGDLRGRSIQVPATTTVRPMADKVKAALFNIVGSVGGQIVLDAYAGSGAVGLEALSRGAAQVVFVERSAPVAALIKRNIASLGVSSEAQVINLPVQTWLNRQSQPIFNLIVADPPYAELDVAILDQLADCLASDGIMVVSHSSKIASSELKSLELVQSKTYGDTALSFYKK